MVSTRFIALAAALLFAAVAQAGPTKPYAPQLYQRDADAIAQDFGDVLAESLERRQGLQSCQTDANCPSNRYCSTRKLKCYLRRGFGATCSRDFACASGYCGRRTGRCANVKPVGRKCYKSDSACQSGYCSRLYDVCATQKATGRRCFVDSGCLAPLKCLGGTCKNPASTASGSPTRKRELRFLADEDDE